MTTLVSATPTLHVENKTEDYLRVGVSYLASKEGAWKSQSQLAMTLSPEKGLQQKSKNFVAQTPLKRPMLRAAITVGGFTGCFDLGNDKLACNPAFFTRCVNTKGKPTYPIAGEREVTFLPEDPCGIKKLKIFNDTDDGFKLNFGHHSSPAQRESTLKPGSNLLIKGSDPGFLNFEMKVASVVDSTLFCSSTLTFKDDPTTTFGNPSLRISTLKKDGGNNQLLLELFVDCVGASKASLNKNLVTISQS